MRADPEVDRPAVGRPDREALDVAQARRLDGDDDAGLDLSAGAAEDRRRADGEQDDERDRAEQDEETAPARRAPALGAARRRRNRDPARAWLARVTRRSRCSRACGAACRRRTAGRSRRPARTSAGRAARAIAAGRSGRSPARSACSCRRRSGRRGPTHSTISPPIASTAGSIASSEPPVVRMSSTSRTRSPGSIRKPRRNSRRVDAVGVAWTSSAKIARTPSWRPVSNARITPPVVGPATRSTRAPAVLVGATVAAQKPHSSLVAAGSDRTANFST